MELGKEDPLCARCCSLRQALEQPSRIAASGIESSCGGAWWVLPWELSTLERSLAPWKGVLSPGKELGTLQTLEKNSSCERAP